MTFNKVMAKRIPKDFIDFKNVCGDEIFMNFHRNFFKKSYGNCVGKFFREFGEFPRDFFPRE